MSAPGNLYVAVAMMGARSGEMTESLSSANPIRLFIGELLQNKPEHDCLRAVYENLAKSDRWAYVFANFHAAGRQIDLAVFTEKTTLVIEAKGYLLTIRGSVNGGVGANRSVWKSTDQQCIQSGAGYEKCAPRRDAAAVPDWRISQWAWKRLTKPLVCPYSNTVH